MTLSWPRLTWPAWDARQAGPRWRKMSATSTAGRDNGRASAGHLPQKVERAGHLADRADGDAGVERRRVEVLQEMRGEAVPQRMNADPLGDAGTPGPGGANWHCRYRLQQYCRSAGRGRSHLGH